MNEINNELGVYGYDEEVELFKSNFEQTGYTSIGAWENDNNIYGIGINDFGNTGFGIISIWKFHNSEDSEDFENYIHKYDLRNNLDNEMSIFIKTNFYIVIIT